MIKTGVCNLPLHPGKCPPWLFKRMVKLGRSISEVLVSEFSEKEFLRRLSDPFWFQALGCTLGYDWNSSGLTTVTCAALKEAINNSDFGIRIAGGKKTAKKTPLEIQETKNSFSLSTSNIQKLVYASRMSSKVDTTLIQDGYQLYHHVLIFTEKAEWAVIQQGLNTENNYARRYHWLSDNVKSFVEEPHSAICCDKKENTVLDMTSRDSKEARGTSVDIVNDNPQHLLKYFNGQTIINDFVKSNKNSNTNNIKKLHLPKSHFIINMKKTNVETLKRAFQIQPKNYEELVAIKGIGPKTIRALALISNLVYGFEVSWRDPAKYSFAHGGKDGIPYPVDKRLYDNNIEIFKEAVNNAKLGDKERLYAIKRLKDFYQ